MQLEKGKLIDKGRTAEVLYWEDNKILKLFKEGYPENRVDFELQSGELVQTYYKNAPKVYGKMILKNRSGILYEYIDGIKLADYLLKNPLHIRRMAKIFASLHVKMHKQRIPGFRSQRVFLKERIQREELLKPIQKKRIIVELDKLKDDTVMCHGDFHMENVLVTRNECYVIDWNDLTAGSSLADVARTLYVLKNSDDPYSSERTWILNIAIKFFRSYFTRIYKKTYKRLANISLKEIRKWNLVIYAVRLVEQIHEEQEWLMKKINKEFKRLHDKN